MKPQKSKLFVKPPKKSKKKFEQMYTAQRFAKHLPDFDFTWMMEDISGKPMKELDRTENAKTVGHWIVWIKDFSIRRGRRLQYDSSALQMNRTLLGPCP